MYVRLGLRAGHVAHLLTDTYIWKNTSSFREIPANKTRNDKNTSRGERPGQAKRLQFAYIIMPFPHRPEYTTEHVIYPLGVFIDVYVYSRHGRFSFPAIHLHLSAH
jgi:hypothetical protein